MIMEGLTPVRLFLCARIIFAQRSLMKKIMLLVASVFYFLSIYAQLKVKFVVQQRPAQHIADTVYMAGSINGWNPGDAKYRFIPAANAWFEMPMLAGEYEFKLTRGNWNKVETSAEGKDIGNRIIKINKDTTLYLSINGWKDDFSPAVNRKKHTASPHVSIIDTAFNMPQLNRQRRIWIYLPQDYATAKKKYPVLYMQDGQNLFDEYTSGFGEWGVDECLDSLFQQGVKECIVVGIDNGPKRMSEYNPYEFKPYGGGEGDQYVDFLALTLKPFIDGHYRTLSGKKNTFVAGSSMGGLISFYAVLKYPKLFGGAGVFSPAFWTAQGLGEAVSKDGSRIRSRLYFYAGGKEGERMVPDMKKIEEQVRSLSHAKLYERVDAEARHNEPAWRKYFPEFYKWTIGGRR